MSRTYPRYGLGRICRWLGYTRQAYYAHGRRRCRRAYEDAVILGLVAEYRRGVGARLGTRKLHALMADDLSAAGIRCGRDRLFAVLRAAGRLVSPQRPRRPRTTDAGAWRRQYPDLRAELLASLGGGADAEAATAPEQLWVADITYVRLAPSARAPAGAFCYVSLVTDAYSRKIVGARVHARLTTDGPLSALRDALAAREHPSRRLVHHSDRGLQYCAGVYVTTLREHGVGVSMTQTGSPYDNALAESVNGQLKSEYGLADAFADVDAVAYALGEAVARYNERRPHGALGMRTPREVHACPEHDPAVAMAWGRLPGGGTTPDRTEAEETTPNRTTTPTDNLISDDDRGRQPLAGLLHQV